MLWLSSVVPTDYKTEHIDKKEEAKTTSCNGDIQTQWYQFNDTKKSKKVTP